MTSGAPAPLRIIADDLTGAVEAAGVLYLSGRSVSVHLGSPVPTGVSTVRDLNIRNISSPAAARIAGDGVRDTAAPDYVKIDSQLRGPIESLIDAAASTGRLVLLCPALPRLGRTVVDGVLLMDGIPLSDSPTSAWSTEEAGAPQSIDDAIGITTPRRHLRLREVRDPSVLRAILDDAEDGCVLVADAQTDADIDALARGLRSSERGTLPVGSSALLHALCAGRGDSTGHTRRMPAPRVLFVIGSLEPVVHTQRQRLPYPEIVSTEADAAVRTTAALRMHGGAVLVSPPHRAGSHDPAVAGHLASVAAAALHDDVETALVLIGGETARRALEMLGEDHLRVVDVIHDGAVGTVAASGRPVVTRPGSFGGSDSLELIARTLLGDRRVHSLEEGQP